MMEKIDIKIGIRRRDALVGALALSAVGSSVAAPRATARTAPAGHAYVGCYTPGPSKGYGPGVALVKLDARTGALSLIRTTPMFDPSWLVISPRQRTLYALNEGDVFQHPPAGGISSYTIDGRDLSLQKMNTVSSGSRAPAYISVHPSGRYLLVANYVGGTVTVLPILEPRGDLGDVLDTEGDKAPLNPAHAADNLPGNHAISDHTGAHMHMVRADPSGRWVIAADAGLDRLLVWSFDLGTGKLTPAATPAINLEPGSAPRHFVFGSHGQILYLVSEQDAMLRAFRFNRDTGALTLFQTVRTLPAAFAGSNLSAELVISADNRFLYATQRLHDAISVMAIDADGRVKMIDEIWTRGDYPRGCTIDPSQGFVFACNQNGDSITSFRRDRASGRLTFTGDYFPIGSPVTMSFLE